MAWFPENQNLPKDTNLIYNFENIAQITGKINSHPSIKCEDMTFIIPVGFDSSDRVRNFGICLLNLIFNTDSKIHVYWSDTSKCLERLNQSKDSQLSFLFDLFKETSLSKNAIENTQFLDFFINKFLKTHLFKNRTNNENTLYESLEVFYLNNQDLIKSKNIFHIIHSWVENQVKKRLTVNLELRKEGEPFHRTKYLNYMLSHTKTKVVVNHDADILLPTQTILSSYTMIKDLNIDVVYPYGYSESSSADKFSIRVFLDSFESTYNATILSAVTGDFSSLKETGQIMKWSSCYGQSIFLNTEKYKKSGGENEQFVSWGAEDVERFVRFVKLGYLVARIKHGYIYHLEHSRGNDSSASNKKFKDNESLWEKIQVLDKNQLVSYYNNCSYIKKYNWNIQ